MPCGKSEQSTLINKFYNNHNFITIEHNIILTFWMRHHCMHHLQKNVKN